MHLGDVIKKYRLEHSMSQAAFAQVSGISKGYISMLENNRNPSTGKPLVPTYTVFESVANVVGCTPDQLIAMMNEDQRIVFNSPESAHDSFASDHPVSSTKLQIIRHLDDMSEDELERFLAVIEMIHKPE